MEDPTEKGFPYLQEYHWWSNCKTKVGSDFSECRRPDAKLDKILKQKKFASRREEGSAKFTLSETANPADRKLKMDTVSESKGNNRQVAELAKAARVCGHRGGLFACALIVASLCSPDLAFGQWRRMGTSAMEVGLAGLATGPMDEVRIALDEKEGTRTFARTSTGQWFSSVDGERWQVAAWRDTNETPSPVIDRKPEAELRAVRTGGRPGLVYAAGNHVWRSEDNGKSWTNLTQVGQASLLGGPAFDISVAPANPEEIAVAAVTGVWKSADGGKSWASWNQELPHLPVRRIVNLPRGKEPLRVSLLAAQPWQAAQLEWIPGERRAWRISRESTAEDLARPVGTSETERLVTLSRQFGASIRVVKQSGSWIYAGSGDGRIWTSLNNGQTWLGPAFLPGTSVEAITVDADNPRIALAVLSRRADAIAFRSGAIMRTTNGGLSWEDLSGDLREPSIWGVAADFRSGQIYVATLKGILQSEGDLRGAAQPNLKWNSIPAEAGSGQSSLPQAPVLDVMLDAAGNQLYAVVYGYGVYQTLAPHRRKEWRVVHSSDYESRPAAPGSLLSVLGGKLDIALAGDQAAAILSANDTETQIQLPYALDGEQLQLRLQGKLEGSQRSAQIGLQIQSTSPSIFVDRDGTPLVLDAESGVLLDAENPARAGSVIQIMAAGLGRVTPELPAGQAAPLGQTFTVLSPVKVALDGVDLPVRKAVLAPGYVGFYLVEVQLPEVVNRGTGIISLQAGNSTSNLVHLHLEP